MRRLFTKYQKVISISVALFLLFICSSFSSATQIEPIPGMIENENKIEKDLREAMDAAGDDEYIPVCLWRKEIDPVELNSLILERSGFDPEIYEDIEAFNEIVAPEIEEEVRAELRQANGSIEPEIKPAENEASLIKRATRERIEEYIHQKRQVSREEYSRRNEAFLESAFANRDDRTVFFCSRYTPTIFIEATKSEIERLVNDETVKSISLHVKFQCKPTICDVLSQVGVYCQGGTGYGYDLPGNYTPLTGTGIKIGVLECFGNGLGGRYNDIAAQLYDNQNLHFIDNIRASGVYVPFTTSYHATMVMSILAGKTIVDNGKTYRGVVPGATIYQTPVVESDDIMTGIEACLDEDVSIINMSLGGCDYPYYSYIDRQVDNYVREDNVVIVVAAGNIGDEPEDYPEDYPPFIPEQITSPGRANNVISVGNAETKISLDEVLSAPYSISSYSCYSEPLYCANKPDLVAPGWVGVPIYNYYENYDGHSSLQPVFLGGTSFSAPIVAGIAAQIIENNPVFGVNPMFVKAALLIGADLSTMNTTDDSLTAPFVYNKIGAGMVNAMNSIDPSIHIEYYGVITQSVIPMNTYDYYYYAGDRIRAVLTFNKYNDVTITSMSDLDNLDLYLVRKDLVNGDQIVSYSSSATNNNEIIDVEIPTDGEYYFIIYVSNIVDSYHPPVAALEFIHYID